MNALAIMYAQGTGVTRSACVAKKLFRQSAAQGYAPEMVHLGMMQAQSNDVRRDGSQAYAWIRAALYVGISDEERDATIFKLGMVAGRLDVSQVDHAEKLARQIALCCQTTRSNHGQGSRTAGGQKPNVSGI